jgi:hypothetical protein
MPQFDLRVGASPLFALLAIALAALAAFLYYRTTLPPVASLRRRLLMVLRGLAIALMLLLILEPVLRIISTASHPPVLTVLVDESKSMGMTDKSGDRSATVLSLLRSHELRRIGEHATVQYVAFSTSPRTIPAESLAGISFTGDGTDIAEALHAAAAERTSGSAHAILLVSDGVTTLGKNPLHDVESYGTPVYTVGVGDPAEQRDILITHIASNAVVYAGVPAPVDVLVKSTGFPGRNVEVSVSDGSRILDRRMLALQDGVREYAVALTYVPEGEGVRSYTVSVSSLPGELTTKNNHRSFTARVRKSALQVLLIAGMPSPDVTALRQALAEVEQFTVRSFTQSPAGAFYEGTLRRETIDSADCIVLAGFPTTTTLPSVAQTLFPAIDGRRVPVMVLATKQSDLRTLDRSASWLPFTVDQPSAAEYEVSVDPSATEKAIPAFTPEHHEADDPWLRLPPVFTTRSTIRVRPDAVVHASTRAQATNVTRPVILSRRVERRRVVAVILHGVWRWRLMAQRSAETKTFYGAFVANTLRWLTAPDEAGPVIARPFKDSFAQGEPLMFTAQVYDARGGIVNDAEVKLVVQRGSESREALLPPRGNGRYEGGTAGIHADGVFRYKVAASRGSTVVGSDSGQVRISGTAIEFLNTRMDAGVLSALSARTGGTFLLPAELGQLDSLLAGDPAFTQRTTSSVSEIHVRMSPWYVGLLVLLFATEWFIRKRSGMI